MTENPETIDIETWMEQVSGALKESIEVIAGLNERLLTVEGQNWALTRLLYSFIKQEIIPQQEAKKQIREMIEVLKDHPGTSDAGRTYLNSAQMLFEQLIMEEQPPTPRFSVIKGGKNDKPA